MMKTLFTLLLLACACCGTESYITYTLSGGRLGDNLLSYCHAKWVSYQSGISLLYIPFPYSSQLKLDQLEIPFLPSHELSTKKVFFSEDLIPLSKKRAMLYVLPYFPECAFELASNRYPYSCSVNWKDLQFRRLLKQAIQPKQNLTLIHPPKQTMNIAIHFREGGNVDLANREEAFPLKFPPFDFYIEGLLKILSLFPEKAFYCYLFTDALNPERYIEKLQQAVPQERPISFDCRLAENASTQNVLEDFFSLFLFDVLIHPQSNFSLIPSLIHDYAVVYTPLSAQIQNGRYVIDQIKFEVNCRSNSNRSAP